MALQPSLPAAAPELPAESRLDVPAVPPVVANGDGAPPAVKPMKLPQARKGGNRALRIAVPLVLAALAIVVVVGVYLIWFRGPQTRADLVTARVGYHDLQLKIVERGTLEAKDNHDIKCEVKAGSRGAPKIKWVVDNGAFVNKGDLLVDIDDSYIQEQALAKKIDRLNAESAKIAAEQTYPQKVIAIKLAEQNLEKWIKGDFPQQLHDLEGQIQTAESNLLQQEDRTSWAGRMVKKGYMTASQEEAEQATLNGDKLALQQKNELKKVLTDYTDPVNRKTFDNALKQAKVDERTAKATMEAAEAVFQQQDQLYKDFLEQIRECKVYAPVSGIVVYAVPEQTRMGSGATQSIIAQGEPVQYGQKMLSIPDLSHMLVNVRIHEAFINNMRDGLPATVRVDAASNKLLKAHVKSVANVASPQDWMSPDVKVYQAYVQIDESVQELKLKPGLSAVSTIFTETRAEHVLAVPVQAVVSPLEKGGKPRCFVQTPHGPEARDVELGMTDEKSVEIKSGLSEGDEVVLNPRVLLDSKERKGGKEDEKIVPVGAGKGKGPGGPGGPGGKGKGGPVGTGGVEGAGPGGK